MSVVRSPSFPAAAGLAPSFPSPLPHPHPPLTPASKNACGILLKLLLPFGQQSLMSKTFVFSRSYSPSWSNRAPQTAADYSATGHAIDCLSPAPSSARMHCLPKTAADYSAGSPAGIDAVMFSEVTLAWKTGSVFLDVGDPGSGFSGHSVPKNAQPLCILKIL